VWKLKTGRELGANRTAINVTVNYKDQPTKPWAIKNATQLLSISSPNN